MRTYYPASVALILKGSVFVVDYKLMMLVRFVWLQSCQATPSEVLDHVLLRGPFSAGARMCPGSRVATLEVQSIVSRIVQDWRFELQDKSFRNVLDVPFMRSMTVQPHNMPKFVFERRGAINQP